MPSRTYSARLGMLAIVLVTLSVVTPACSSRLAVPQNNPEVSEADAGPADAQSEFLKRTPYPYSHPLPDPTPTVLDGTYTKFDPRQADHIPCKRCPPYPPEGGVWRLNLEKGVFRVYHAGTGWFTVGSFTVSGDRIQLFNDPHCYQDTGVYAWELEGGELVLEAVEDNCGVYLRAQSLVALPWDSCQPPGTEAAVTDHWPRPPGCN
jgi:hypothetical protein